MTTFKETLMSILCVEKDGSISHTKFWSNIGFFLLSSAFTASTIQMIVEYDKGFSNWMDVFWAFGIIVALQRGTSKYISAKYPNSNLSEEDKKIKQESTEPKK